MRVSLCYLHSHDNPRWSNQRSALEADLAVMRPHAIRCAEPTLRLSQAICEARSGIAARGEENPPGVGTSDGAIATVPAPMRPPWLRSILSRPRVTGQGSWSCRLPAAPRAAADSPRFPSQPALARYMM
jgi:hypothetical protein